MPSRPTNARRRTLLQCLAGLPICTWSLSIASVDDFRVFDGLLHRTKPNLWRQGLEPIAAISEIWRPGSPRESVDEQGVIAAVKRLPESVTVAYVDIEVWPLLMTPPAVRAASIEKYLQVARIVRRVRPTLQFGFYGAAPAITYWPLQDHRLQDYHDWVETNAALRPLAEICDFVFPSLYTFYQDRPGWVNYARQTIEAARQYGRPVVPFLWFEYHDSNPQLRDREVDLQAWREELQFCKEAADGVVLWGGYQRNWRDSAPWWQASVQELRLRSRTPS